MTKISFYGGVGTVTGSKYLLEHNGRRVLVDCGLFQGLKELRERNWQDPPFDPRGIDAIIITHAHIDHTGYLPRVVKLGYEGPVFTSNGSSDLLKILLPDSGRLQEEEADYRNRHALTSHSPALPLYDENDAKSAIKLIKAVPNDGRPVEVCEGITASFLVAGHIIGASLVLIEMASTEGPIRFLFSGDLGHYDQPIVKDPAHPPECDYLMVESTYGNRLHGDVSSDVQMARIINEAADRDGPILIPAFAVGRTQEVLYLIRELEDAGRIPVLPVIVDSPMAAQATQVYNRWTEEHDEEYASILMQKRHPLRTASMQTTSTRDESKRLNTLKGSRIIVSASGMMTGGRVLHHAMRMLPDENATVIFVGYQAAGTTGRRILDGEREVKIMKNWVPVRCRIEKVEGFSAHADWKAVIRWLEGMPGSPRMVFTTHGEPDAAEAMAGHIRDRFGWSVVVPEYGQSIEL
ncbi:MAG TPA: MBL fold metallo-hydrolase [Pyrinomonadaceae bacterium]|nr:MBL fold metallo-hydrolase [Chloracidobacterium sp.]HBE81603.1 MBL fold metallo-hydrolase [Blastocatellia bacterium]HRJ89118.1 MBL fold metallo-hydrolase [Pyrinomonadaceae bacterium]HRK50171.1 MBL fold metallo-hydrolase [Pyrinomonadaceae bacterium]